jgi:hypothetical protein
LGSAIQPCFNICCRIQAIGIIKFPQIIGLVKKPELTGATPAFVSPPTIRIKAVIQADFIFDALGKSIAEITIAVMDGLQNYY